MPLVLSSVVRAIAMLHPALQRLADHFPDVRLNWPREWVMMCGGDVCSRYQHLLSVHLLTPFATFHSLIHRRTDNLNFPGEVDPEPLSSELLIKLLSTDNPAGVEAALAAASVGRRARLPRGSEGLAPEQAGQQVCRVGRLIYLSNDG